MAIAAAPRLRSFDHCSNRLRVERLPALVAVARIFQSSGDFALAQATGLAFYPSKATRFGDDLRPQLGV
jgi:hypothetical protein